jgi:hypothetical protein
MDPAEERQRETGPTARSSPPTLLLTSLSVAPSCLFPLPPSIYRPQ